MLHLWGVWKCDCTRGQRRTASVSSSYHPYVCPKDAGSFEAMLSRGMVVVVRFLFVCLLFCLLGTEHSYVAQTGFEVVILLSQLPEC